LGQPSGLGLANPRSNFCFKDWAVLNFSDNHIDTNDMICDCVVVCIDVLLLLLLACR